ncbi:choice-of-anchor D domain-containing protein [Kribbella sp. NPDC026596]|uniref:choice-of-anchor D domain-containing protein n=1 Tax=Kribbella sp. NPDC026596 TaxID=3155122 RepID=UPI0033CF932F
MRRARKPALFRAALAAALAAITVPFIAHAAFGDETAMGVITTDVLLLDNSFGVKRITDDTEIISATTKDDGELHLSNTWFGPPIGQRFANGTTYDVAAVRTTSVGSIGNVCRTFQNQHAAVKSGTLTVDSVEYDGDTVTSIAASWIVECAASNGSTSSQGFLRFAGDGPHPLVTPAPVTMPEAGRSNPVEATVTLTNAGDAATGTLGAATVDPAVASGQYYKVATDRCAGTILAPSQACTVDVVYERDTAGYAQARIAVAAPGYPGGKILAGVGGTAVAAPTDAPIATPYPILNGQGISWFGVLRAAWFQVERRLPTEDWQNVSGRISGNAMSWADHTLPAGSTAEYRVTAGNADGASPPSAIVTATRPSAAVDTGSVNALSVDADGAGRTLDQVTTSFDETWAYTRHRTLHSVDLSVTLPDLPGPGVYEVAPEAARHVSIRQSAFECPFAGTLRVDQLAYADDFRPITTLTATADGVCRTDEGDSPRVVLELRVNSAQPLAAVAVSPIDAGRVAVGQQSEPKAVTIRNTGTTQVELGQPSVVGTTSGDWTIQTNHCPATLAAGATCTVDVVARPSAAGTRSAQLEMTDSTTRGRHHAALTVTGLGTAGPPKNLKAIGTLTGVDLSWDLPADNGESEVTGYTVHRLVDGIETTFQAARVEEETTSRWTDSNPPAGATYAVSARNQIGDGEPTTAQAPRRTSDVLAYSNGGLYQWALPDGTQPVPVGSGTPSQDVGEMAASSDGRYLAYAADGALWTVRADSSAVSTPVRVASAGTVWDIAWSPDRSRLAYAQGGNGEEICVWVVTLPTGDPVKVRCGVWQPSWLPDMQALVVADADHGMLERVEAKANGAVLGTYAGTEAGTTPVVSPDGRWIAYTSVLPTHHVSLVPLAGGVSPSVTVSYAPQRLSWSPGADRLLLWGHPNAYSTIAVAADGTLGKEVSLFAGYVEGIRAPVWQGLSVTIPPTAAVTGRTVSIPFDVSALSSGTQTTCRLDAGAWAPCTTPYRATGVIGGAHTLIVKATEPSGRTVVSSRFFTVDATGPVARMMGPAYQSSVAATATLTVSATDAGGVASYDVRYRRATSAGPYGDYVQPWTNTTATSMNLAVAAGYEYCASVRAKDKFGNVGGWSADRCFSRPLDDRSLTMASTGWTRATGSTFYYGTTTQTTAYGKSLTRSVQGKRFFLVATRCPTCGSVAVYAGNTRLTTVNLAYPTTHRQVLLGLPVLSTLFSGTLKFVSASSGKLVQIDGLAVGRT